MGATQLTFDAENRITQSYNTTAQNSTCYAYDGLGERVAKWTYGGSSCAGTWALSEAYVYDAFGNLAVESEVGSAPAPACLTCYLTWDHLGSVRMVSDAVTGGFTGFHDYAPFGAEVLNNGGRSADWGTAGNGTDYLNQRYTGAERDTESTLDFLQARYLANQQGRFVSADPVGNFVADPGNPQSWNMYSYVGNNPLAFIDPSGLCSVKEGDDAATDDPGEPCVAPGDTSTTVTDTAPPVDYQNSDIDSEDFLGLTFYSDVFGSSGGGGGGQPSRACVSSALRSVIARGEGTAGQPGGGYGTLVRGTVIRAPAQFRNLIGTRNAQIANPAALAGHPNILVQVQPGPNSTAFGRYQIIAGTARAFGFNDFSPAGQDAAANTLMQSRGMINLAIAGNVHQAIRAGGNIWASLPGSPYGQPTISMNTAMATYNQAIGGCR